MPECPARTPTPSAPPPPWPGSSPPAASAWRPTCTPSAWPPTGWATGRWWWRSPAGCSSSSCGTTGPSSASPRASGGRSWSSRPRPSRSSPTCSSGRAGGGFYQLVLGVLLAGVLGNMYDRIAFGSVRDMIHAVPRLALAGRRPPRAPLPAAGRVPVRLQRGRHAAVRGRGRDAGVQLRGRPRRAGPPRRSRPGRRLGFVCRIGSPRCGTGFQPVGPYAGRRGYTPTGCKPVPRIRQTAPSLRWGRHSCLPRADVPIHPYRRRPSSTGSGVPPPVTGRNACPTEEGPGLDDG